MRLVDSFADVFIQLSEWFDDDSNNMGLSLDVVTRKFDSLLKNQEALARKMGFEQDTIQDSLYGVLSLIDEKILSSSWDEKNQWRGNLLQRRYLNTTNGGVLFFEKLEKLNPFNPIDSELRTVFYYCLSLGFKGKYYREEDQVILSELKNNSLNVLDKQDMGYFFPQAYNLVMEKRPLPTTPVNWWPLYFLFPVLLVMAVYMHFDGKMNTLIQTLLANFA